MKKLDHWTLTLLGFALLTLKAHSQDMPLSMLLIEGEGWKLVSEGHAFTDAPCADDKGNFYFSDMRSTPPVFWASAVPLKHSNATIKLPIRTCGRIFLNPLRSTPGAVPPVSSA